MFLVQIISWSDQTVHTIGCRQIMGQSLSLDRLMQDLGYSSYELFDNNTWWQLASYTDLISMNEPRPLVWFELNDHLEWINIESKYKFCNNCFCGVKMICEHKKDLQITIVLKCFCNFASILLSKYPCRIMPKKTYTKYGSR